MNLQHSTCDSLKEIQESHGILVETFQTGLTKDISWRKWQLKQLWWLIEDNEKALVDAIKHDLNRHESESHLTDLVAIRSDILNHLKNIDAWTADEPIGDSFLIRWLGIAHIKKEPLGVVLIIGAWNFPLLLVFQPLIAAISAGCCAILKPSESAVACQNLLHDLVKQYLDPSAIRMVCGGAHESTKLLELRFNHIFFTGSAKVGRIISKAAAAHLTPVTLELGGQCPAIVSRSADIDRAAKSIAFAKFLNAGQICLSVNHVFVDPTVHDALLDRLQYWIRQFLDQRQTITTAIINQSHWTRISDLLQQTKGKIVCGGGGSNLSRQLEPTVVVDIDMDDILLEEEIFGPVCPVLKADTRQACRLINEREYPLALYIFSTNHSEIQAITSNTNSGGVTINDVILHAGFPGAPFGGVGGSGHGYYHGPYGFKSFTHLRTIMNVPWWMSRLTAFRYPPYTVATKLKIPKRKAFFKRGESIHDQERKASVISASRVAVGVALGGFIGYYCCHHYN